MRLTLILPAAMVAGFLVACGGGGGGTIITPAPGPSASSSPAGSNTSSSISQTISLSMTAADVANYAITGSSAQVSYPAASAATTLTTTFSSTAPANTPTLQARKRRPAAIGGSQIAGFAYLCLAPGATTTLTTLPSFTLTVSSSIANAATLAYVALYDPTNAAAGWTTVEGPPVVSGTTLLFAPATTTPLALQSGQTYCFAFFTVASALASPSASPSPSPSPSPLPLTQTVSVAVSATTTGTGTYATQPYAGTVLFHTASSGSATLTTVMASTLAAALAPSGATVASSPPATSGAFLCVTASSTVTLSSYPFFEFSVPAWYTAADDVAMSVAIANPVAGNSWANLGTATPTNGNLLSFFYRTRGGLTLIGGQTYCFAFSGSTVPMASPSPVATTAAGLPAWTSTQHTDYVAISYNGNTPQYIGIYAPGETAPSTTLTLAGCCVEQLQFDSHGNLLVATSQSGILEAAPGATSLASFLPSQSGFSLGINASNTLAIGGYNTGSNVAVYPAESAVGSYSLPGQPEFASLAVSPSGEVAVPQSNGTVNTYPSGSTTANRSLNIAGLELNGVNTATVAYDASGNLAVGGNAIGTVSVFAPGATTASYTISGIGEAQALEFDVLGRLIIGEAGAIAITSNGQTKITLPNVTPVYMNVGSDGSFGYAGYNNPSQVFQVDGRIVTIATPYQSLGIAISP